MVERTDYSLGFSVALIIHVIALFLLGMAYMIKRNDETVLPPQTDMLTLSLVEDVLSDNPSPKNADTAPRPQPETRLELLRVPQPTPDPPMFTDRLNEMMEIPKHTLPNLEPPSPVIVIQTPSPLPDKTVMPPLATLLASQETTDPASLHSDSTGGVLQGALSAPTTKDQAIHPKYPMNSRRKGEQGRVILDVLVSKDGAAISITLVSSSGFKDLDIAAKEAVMLAKFKPGARNGKPVDASARITILFQLNQN
jgi:protein TonB